MSIIHDYLYDTWNERGVVEDEETIQLALQHNITDEQAMEVPSIVESFISTIIIEEGRIEYEGYQTVKKRIANQA